MPSWSISSSGCIGQGATGRRRRKLRPLRRRGPAARPWPRWSPSLAAPDRGQQPEQESRHRGTTPRLCGDVPDRARNLRAAHCGTSTRSPNGSAACSATASSGGPTSMRDVDTSARPGPAVRRVPRPAEHQERTRAGRTSRSSNSTGPQPRSSGRCLSATASTSGTVPTSGDWTATDTSGSPPGPRRRTAHRRRPR